MPIRPAAAPVVVGLVVALVLYAALALLHGLSQQVGVEPTREPVPEGAFLGALRALAGSPPSELLHAAPTAPSLITGFAVTLVLWQKARMANLNRRVAEQVSQADRWELHGRPRKEPSSAVPVTPAEAGWAALAWPLVYLASGWLLRITERLLDLAADLGLASATGPLVADPVPAQAAAATLAAAFVLWRRRAIRVGETKMLGGKIDH